MFRIFSETLSGVQYRGTDHKLTCASAWTDVGENYSLFVVAEYIAPPPLTASTTAEEIVALFMERADENLLAAMFEEGCENHTEYFDPVFEFIEETVKQDNSKRQRVKMDVGCLIVEKSTMKVKFGARGNVHILMFDKEHQEYEFMWPRFKGVTAMWGMTDLTDRYNLLIANEAMFLKLYNRKEKRLYRLYEDMMLEDLNETFNLKGLSDLTYISIDLSHEKNNIIS